METRTCTKGSWQNVSNQKSFSMEKPSSENFLTNKNTKKIFVKSLLLVCSTAFKFFTFCSCLWEKWFETMLKIVYECRCTVENWKGDWTVSMTSWVKFEEYKFECCCWDARKKFKFEKGRKGCWSRTKNN